MLWLFKKETKNMGKNIEEKEKRADAWERERKGIESRGQKEMCTQIRGINTDRH